MTQKNKLSRSTWRYLLWQALGCVAALGIAAYFRWEGGVVIALICAYAFTAVFWTIAIRRERRRGRQEAKK